MIRILLDQCVPRSAATILRNGGWDVVHTGEIGLSRAMDAYMIGRINIYVGRRPTTLFNIS